MGSVCDRYCANCIYFGGVDEAVATCNYILRTGKKRPCGAGYGCTVKVKRANARKLKHRFKGGGNDGNL